MTETFTIEYKRYTPSDPRLGRHVQHDSRSLNYQVEAAPLDSLKSVRHARRIPILNQGSLGSCTGNASVGVLGSGLFWDSLSQLLAKQSFLSTSDASADEKYAVDVYSAATGIDPFRGTYPPTDTGSDGLSVAKILQKRGLISGYQHATSLEATLTALSKQPVMIGTEWLDNMFEPKQDGRIVISGSLDGGHEYELDELDVENRRVWLANSWSEGWGIAGRAYLTWDDLGTLLAARGDCTVFTPLTKPAPTPTPPTPTPPAPTPTPTDPQASLKAATAKLQQAMAEFNTAWQSFEVA